jgi:hypothetical protein
MKEHNTPEDYLSQPLPLSLSPDRNLKLTSIPAEMIARIATGLEDDLTVAKFYGYTEDEYERLLKNVPFQKLIADKRNELEASGVTYRNKMKLFAEAMAEEVFQTAMAQDSSFRAKLDAAEFFTKAGDLLPKQKTSDMDVTPRFVVNINIPQIDANAAVYDPTKTIDADEGSTFLPEIEFDFDSDIDLDEIATDEQDNTDVELHTPKESDSISNE